MTAHLLFAYKQARPDIQVAVAFLCTWVKAPIEEDYKKLARCIRYLQNIFHLPLLIGWDETGVLMWNVNVAFVVHEDMKNHTRAALTIEKGALLYMSMKKNIDSKCSTEAKLVGVDDAMNFVVWSKLFFDWQMQHHEEGMKSKEMTKVIFCYRTTQVEYNLKGMGNSQVQNEPDTLTSDIFISQTNYEIRQ